MMLLSMMLAIAAPVATAEDVTVAGPQGPLAGTYLPGAPPVKGGRGPAVVIIPGSGPTDRDGNSPIGIAAGTYRLLAEALAQRGVASIRIDKRGMFGSRAAVKDGNLATIQEYAADAHAWAALAAERAGTKCAWLVGHSEGALVALQAAQDATGLCGVILIAGPGRPMAEVMREQFSANPANLPILVPALAMIDAIQAGKTVDPASLPAPLSALFPLVVQRYMIGLFAVDPAALATSAKVPVTIVQGDADLQVTVADAQRLAKARPKATLALLPGVNHVLKTVGTDRAANMRSYADPSLPIAPSAIDAVAAALGR